MAISYNKLWKLLIDRKMSKADLRRAAGIAPNTDKAEPRRRSNFGDAGENMRRVGCQYWRYYGYIF